MNGMVKAWCLVLFQLFGTSSMLLHKFLSQVVKMRSSIICSIPPLMLAESYEVVEYVPTYN